VLHLRAKTKSARWLFAFDGHVGRGSPGGGGVAGGVLILDASATRVGRGSSR